MGSPRAATTAAATAGDASDKFVGDDPGFEHVHGPAGHGNDYVGGAGGLLDRGGDAGGGDLV